MKKGVSRKVVKVEDGKSVMLEVHDTGGMERYATIPRNYYTGVHGAIVLYDMTEPETLENAPWWHREGTRNGTENAVYMLMGNKVDAVKADALEAETKRGKEKADDFSALYAQVSAKTGQNIEDAFRRLAQAMADSAEEEDDGDAARVADKPEEGKVYALTGGPGSKCIANGYTWKDSVVGEDK